MEDAAILIAPHGSAGPLRGMIERLSSNGVATTVVDELPAAIEVAQRTARSRSSWS